MRYVQKPALGKYLLVVLVYTFGLMAKPMLVTLPLTLLLLDYWPLKRFSSLESRRAEFPPPGRGKARVGVEPTEIHPSSNARSLLLDKLPLFTLAIASSAVTFVVQHSAGATASLGHNSLGVRIDNAVLSYAVYLGKMVRPLNLAVFYPHPKTSIPVLEVVAAAAFLTLCG